MPGNQPEFQLSSCDFYLQEMHRAVDMGEAGAIPRLAWPIFSFFHGTRVDEASVPVQTGHVDVFLEREMANRLRREPALFPRWVEVMYGYFWKMAAVPALAGDIWTPLWMILKVFEGAGEDTMPARCQMAAWAASYDDPKKTTALAYIKAMRPLTPQAAVKKSLFLSTKINKGASDFSAHVAYAYARSHLLPPIHRLQAHINFYCENPSSDEGLTDILSILNWNELVEYRQGKMELLGPLYWTLVHENRYDALLFFVRCLKGIIVGSGLGVAHAFLLPTDGKRFAAITKSDLVTFEDRDNGQSYTTLIRLVNRTNKVAISLLGEHEIDYRVDEKRFGTPDIDEDFDELRDAVIAHYRLDDAFYRELKLITSLPSHNHPIQGALCSLGITPPLISTSLQNLGEEPRERAFIFFLSSSTYTHDLELACIRKEFGEETEVFTDPSCDFFIESLSNERYTHIYVSAHGVYSHWEDEEETIHFSETSRIPASRLWEVSRSGSHRRTVVLNICDGAASPLSFNPNNRGLAASLATGNQVVISHIWPVHPLYAAIFGLLVLDELIDGSAADAVLSVSTLLRLSNAESAAIINDKGPAFVEIAGALASATFAMADFRNVGSVAIYA
ncbi:hypothetical protein [Caballeronia glebae]|uniref:hypothetical protein n=1 Tax=Caballeronia glebae TaxID=1777143 RepID=UPI0038B7D9C6